MNDEFETLQLETILSYSKVPSQSSLIGTEEKHAELK
jgi:hypothetical protein